MIIEKISIDRFRGFNNVEFLLGKYLTIIAGQNGTQKTTLLGILSQPFSLTDESNPMRKEKPLCGGNFRSSFSEKFKFSDSYDKIGGHEWTLHINNQEPFTAESIRRRKDSELPRFWKKGDRAAGSGYLQFPVIYLSLKRLIPIGEDPDIEEDKTIGITSDEINFLKKWHNKILNLREKVTDTSYLSSGQKNTFGANTATYDWKLNSAGQDNVGKILAAVLSFKRLKSSHPDHYQGGILAVDEIDATLHPAAQLKLMEALRKFASQYSIQIICTTHSLTILENVCALQKTPAFVGQNKVIYLEKLDNKVHVIEDVTFNTIKHKLEISIGKVKDSKVDVYTEDLETAIFAKALLKTKSSKLNFIKCKLGCGNLIDLATRKVPSFSFPNSIIILDGDVRKNSPSMRKINNFKNFLILPTSESPEQILASYLDELSDHSPLWKIIHGDFNKQFCFDKYQLDDITRDRELAKKWFQSMLPLFGKNATKVINSWVKTNPEIRISYLDDFKTVFNRYAQEVGVEKL